MKTNRRVWRDHRSRNRQPQTECPVGILRALAAVPDPCSSETQFLRYTHHDLEARSFWELVFELGLLRARLRREIRNTPRFLWLVERLWRLRAECSGRRMKLRGGRAHGFETLH